MSSLRIATFCVFDVDPNHKESKVAVSWEKQEGYFVQFLYKLPTTEAHMTECRTLKIFPLDQNGEDDAIRYAFKFYRAAREEYEEHQRLKTEQQ